MNRPLILLLALSLLALTACGQSEEEKVEEVLTSFATNLEDEKATCETFSQAQLEKESRKKGDEAVDLCRAQFKDQTSPKEFEVRSVKVDGDKATAEVSVDGENSEVQLVKEDGDWKVSGT